MNLIRFSQFFMMVFISCGNAQEQQQGESKQEQCLLYGSYEVSEGIWEACDYQYIDEDNLEENSQSEETQDYQEDGDDEPN